MQVGIKSLLVIYISIIIILGLTSKSHAQTYSLQVNSTTFSLDGTNFNGYTTSFVQSHKEVKKEWWRYINSRTVIFNKKTHLELTIPAQKKESNTPLKFVSQLTEDKENKKSLLRLALDSNGVPEDQIKGLQKQAASLLKDFKVSYFTQLIQEKIVARENDSKKISVKMDKFLLNNSKLQLQIEKKPEATDKLMKELKANTNEIENLQKRLNATQKQLADLKKELTLIK